MFKKLCISQFDWYCFLASQIIIHGEEISHQHIEIIRFKEKAFNSFIEVVCVCVCCTHIVNFFCYGISFYRYLYKFITNFICINVL